MINTQGNYIIKITMYPFQYMHEWKAFLFDYHLLARIGNPAHIKVAVPVLCACVQDLGLAN